MSSHRYLSTAFAGALALAALASTNPASAASRHERPCTRYSVSMERCLSHSLRPAAPQGDALFEGSGGLGYRYHFEPPEGTNGPYLGYQPYNGFSSNLGMSF